MLFEDYILEVSDDGTDDDYLWIVNESFYFPSSSILSESDTSYESTSSVSETKIKLFSTSILCDRSVLLAFMLFGEINRVS